MASLPFALQYQAWRPVFRSLIETRGLRRIKCFSTPRTPRTPPRSLTHQFKHSNIKVPRSPARDRDSDFHLFLQPRGGAPPGLVFEEARWRGVAVALRTYLPSVRERGRSKGRDTSAVCRLERDFGWGGGKEKVKSAVFFQGSKMEV